MRQNEKLNDELHIDHAASVVLDIKELRSVPVALQHFCAHFYDL